MVKIRIPIDVDDRGAVVGMRKLVSEVRDSMQQLDALATIEPTINTAGFSTSLKTMRQSMEKLNKMAFDQFTSGRKISYKVDGKSHEVDFNKATANRYNMTKYSGQWKAAIASGAIKREEDVKLVKEFIEYVDTYKIGWGGVTREVKNHNRAIEMSIQRERELTDRQNKRLAELRTGLKSAKDLEKATLSETLSQQKKRRDVSNYANSWGTGAGRAIAEQNDKELAKIDAIVKQKKEQEKVDKSILSLLARQDELLEKQKRISGQSLKAIGDRKALANQIVGIQQKLAGTGFSDKSILDQQLKFMPKEEAALTRKYFYANRDLNAADSILGANGKDVDALRKKKGALNSLINLKKGEYISTGNEELLKDVDEYQKQLDGVVAKIKEVTSANAKLTKQERAAREKRIAENKAERAAAQARAEENRKLKLADAESRIENAKAARERAMQDKDSIQSLIAQRKATNDLINALRMKRNATRDANTRTNINSQLAQLEEENWMTTRAINDYRAGRSDLSKRDARIKQLKAENRELLKQSNILGRLKSQLAMYFSLYGIINLGRKIVETTGFFEQQRVALEGITGSAEKAGVVLNQIMDFAIRSPFQTSDLVRFTKQLSAFSVPVDQLFDKTKRLADISAGLGVDMSRIVLAYGQVKSAAVLRGQELRQFTEAGIPMVDRLAKKLSELRGELVTTGQVFEAISKRQVSFEMVDSVLKDLTSEGGQFYNMQENINKTVYGQVQKTKDLWTLAFNELGKESAGLINYIVQKVQFAAQRIKSIIYSISGYIISQSLVKTAVYLKAIYNWVNILRLKGMEAALTFVTLKSIIAPIVTILSVAGGYIYGLVEKANVLNKKFKEIDESVNKTMSSSIQGLGRIINKMQELEIAEKKNSKEFNDLFDTLKNNYGDFITDEMLNKFKEERRSVEKVAESYAGLQRAIEGAILAKSNYLRLNDKEDAAAGEITKWLRELGNNGLLEHGKINEILLGDRGVFEAAKGDGVKKAVEGAYNLNTLGITRNELETNVANAAADAFNLIRQKDLSKTTVDENGNSKVEFDDELAKTEFAKLFTTALKQAIPAMSTGYDTQIGDVISRTWEKLTAQDNYQTWKGQYVTLGQTAPERIKRFYTGINPTKDIAYEDEKGNKLSTVDYDKEQQKLWFEATQNAFNAEFANNKEIESVKGYSDFIDALSNGINKFKQDSGYNILSALEELRSNLPETLQYANEILLSMYNELNSRINPVSGRAAIVRGRIFGNNDFDNDLVKEIFKEFGENLTTANYEDVRESLPKRYQEKKSEYDKYIQGDEKDAEYIKKLKAQMDMLKTLGEQQYFAIDVEKKKSGGGGYRQLFSDLFGMLKEARSQEKKLIGKTGYTKAFTEDVNDVSGPLHDVYQKDKNPFESILSKWAEYGIEDFFTKADFQGLQTKFENSNGQMEPADYKQLWEDLIKKIRDKANGLGTGDESTKNALLAYAQQVTAEMEKIFSRDEIQEKIDEALKELRGVNNTFARIENNRKNYKDLLPLIGADAAKEAFGPIASRTGYKESVVAGARLQSLASAGSAKGLMSVENQTMEDFRTFLEGGALNISNLGKLFSIIQGLEGMSKDSNVEQEFKDIIPTFIEALNKLIEAILGDEKRIAEDQGDYYKAGNLGTSYAQALKDRNNSIDTQYERDKERIMSDGTLTEDQKKDEIKKLDSGRATAKIQATQGYYTSLQGDLYSSWARVLNGDSEKGVSDKGRRLDNFLHKSSLQDIYAKKRYAEVGTDASEDAYAKAAEDVANFAAKCENAADVISTVSQVIQGVGSITDSVFNLMDSTNGVHLNEDGVYVQDNDYTADKQIVGTIMDFAEGMGGAAQAFMSGDYLGAIIQGITTLIDFFSNVFNSMDAVLQEEINKLEVSNAGLGKRIEKLTNQIKDAVGGEVWDIQKEQMLLQKKQIENLRKMEELEAQKKKGDPSQAQAYRDEWMQLEETIKDTIRSIRDEVLGTADELSSTLSDAFVEAFRNGQNAARAWKDATLGYVSDVLKNIIFEKALARDIENVFEKAVGKSIDDIGFEDLSNTFKNESKVRGLVDGVNGVFKSAEAIKDELPQYVKDVLFYNPSSQALGSGIQSITEDTGRTLEALQVSMLTQMVQQTNALNQIANSSILADVQASWFNSMLSQTRMIRIAVEHIDTSIDELRTTSSRPINMRLN